jgi:uncharacterized protein (TIGR03437 family)
MSILGRVGAPGVDAILAGEPTGGKPGAFGEVRQQTLPSSGLRLQVSSRLWPVLDGIPARNSLYPDLDIGLRSTDYFARHDPALAAALVHASAAPKPPSGRAIVVNSASFRYHTGIAPGSLASAFGTFPAGDLKLTVNGVAAQLVNATTTQLGFVVPPQTQPGPSTLEVRLGTELVADGQFQTTPAGPGLFVANAADPAQPGAILNQDSVLNAADRPAPAGSVLQIFATGYGPADGSTAVWIANRPAEVLHSVVVGGVPGLWQINARVPEEAAESKEVPVFLSSHGFVSNGVTIHTTTREN